MIPELTESDQLRMNTLLVVPWDNPRGGVVGVVENVARCLQQQGHEALYFHSGPTILLKNRVTKLGFPGVQLRLCLPFGPGLRGVLRTVAFPFLFTVVLLQLLWLLRTHRIKIVNLHYPIDNFFYFAICRRLLSIRLVTSVHGRDAFYRERPLARYSGAFKFIVRSSDLVILPSEAYRRLFLEAFPETEQRTVFIHNAVNPARFRPADPERQRGDSNRYLLCVAELQEYKAIDVLLHAAAPLLADDPCLTLVLAGDGPLRAELEGLASSLNIRHRTMFLGTQGAFEIVQLLHGCEAMVLPSRMEPFGIAIIEAMACKKPVVATAVGGIPEIIEHEVSGILVEPENPRALAAALRRVLGDSELRSIIAENGYTSVMKRFCSKHQGASYEAAFASVWGLSQRISDIQASAAGR